MRKEENFSFVFEDTEGHVDLSGLSEFRVTQSRQQLNGDLDPTTRDQTLPGTWTHLEMDTS